MKILLADGPCRGAEVPESEGRFEVAISASDMPGYREVHEYEPTPTVNRDRRSAMWCRFVRFEGSEQSRVPVVEPSALKGRGRT